MNKERRAKSDKLTNKQAKKHAYAEPHTTNQIKKMESWTRDTDTEKPKTKIKQLRESKESNTIGRARACIHPSRGTPLSQTHKKNLWGRRQPLTRGTNETRPLDALAPTRTELVMCAACILSGALLCARKNYSNRLPGETFIIIIINIIVIIKLSFLLPWVEKEVPKPHYGEMI